MRNNNVLEIGAATIMIFVAGWKGLQALIFLPLAGAAHMRDYAPFAVELLLMLASVLLSFTRQFTWSAATASCTALAALAYWWFVICRTTTPIWSDFEWLTIPDFIFTAAALLRWFSLRTRTTAQHQEPMEAENV